MPLLPPVMMAVLPWSVSIRITGGVIRLDLHKDYCDSHDFL
jgi:hypothetical protein